MKTTTITRGTTNITVVSTEIARKLFHDSPLVMTANAYVEPMLAIEEIDGQIRSVRPLPLVVAETLVARAKAAGLQVEE